MTVYKDGHELTALWQFDQGVTVSLGGLADLPTVVEFTVDCEPCVSVTPTTETVEGETRYVAAVPDVLLERGLPLYIYARQTEDEAHCTVSLAIIPVRQRPPAEDYVPASDPAYIDVAELKAAAEMKANKVQEISDDATNEQYPSAKAVVDYVSGLGVIPIVDSPNIWQLGTGLYWLTGAPRRTTSSGWNFGANRNLFYVFAVTGGVRYIHFGGASMASNWQAPICGYTNGSVATAFTFLDTSALDVAMPAQPTDTHTMSTKAIKEYIDQRISEVTT